MNAFTFYFQFTIHSPPLKPPQPWLMDSLQKPYTTDLNIPGFQMFNFRCNMKA